MKKEMEKKPEIRKFRKEEASWLAGVIDGEGSVGLYDYGKEGRRVCIQISNTDEDFVAETRRIIGCGSQINRSNRCYWVLKQIIPYLIIKKSKALSIIKELENKPFGRWINCTEEYRKLSSERLKKEWRDPIIRKNRIEGMRGYYESKKK